jgi:hypothetical protein
MSGSCPENGSKPYSHMTWYQAALPPSLSAKLTFMPPPSFDQDWTIADPSGRDA